MKLTEGITRPENIWSHARRDDLDDQFHRWWSKVFYRNCDLHRVKGHLHPRLFQRVLGRQDTTVIYRHRCYVWERPDEGWFLYVDRRGPQLCVRGDAGVEDAWNAFQAFRTRVDAWFAANPAKAVPDA